MPKIPIKNQMPNLKLNIYYWTPVFPRYGSQSSSGEVAIKTENLCQNAGKMTYKINVELLYVLCVRGFIGQDSISFFQLLHVLIYLLDFIYSLKSRYITKFITPVDLSSLAIFEKFFNEAWFFKKVF